MLASIRGVWGLFVKRCVLGGLAALVLSGPAQSADLYPSRPALAFKPYDWTGIYLGVHGGYAYANAVATIGGGGLSLSHSDRVSGQLAGGQIGFNSQAGPIVIGLEADASRLWQSKTYSAGVPGFSASVESEIPWLSTLRARAGFALDQWLVYATGGVALTGVKTTGTATLGPFSTSASVFEPKAAFVWGAGVETALWASNWTARAEYLHVETIDTSEFTGGITLGTQASNNIWRLGVNYRFGR